MKRAATILLTLLVLSLVAYMGYVYGNMVGRMGENVNWTPLSFVNNGEEEVGKYEEKLRRLQAIGNVKWDIIMEYDSALGSVDDKAELLRHARRLEVLWQSYDLLMAKYGLGEDTLQLIDTGDEEEE